MRPSFHLLGASDKPARSAGSRKEKERRRSQKVGAAAHAHEQAGQGKRASRASRALSFGGSTSFRGAPLQFYVQCGASAVTSHRLVVGPVSEQIGADWGIMESTEANGAGNVAWLRGDGRGRQSRQWTGTETGWARQEEQSLKPDDWHRTGWADPTRQRSSCRVRTNVISPGSSQVPSPKAQISSHRVFAASGLTGRDMQDDVEVRGQGEREREARREIPRTWVLASGHPIICTAHHDTITYCAAARGARLFSFASART
ncbi:hypothetical protein J7T55_013158 [Diaporthe amygdali]|uniref:uncharacterized protein n=1 Tax=Phomopsis amygdali TaxID=1214568 RepID=UPI0022FE77E2|nr:uncharacterized protein J7T55_013158 [Diaporthe amygdali]KAJ0118902.1 hypothetical protein J7T55_013158 [Diaporthe amygdali]